MVVKKSVLAQETSVPLKKGSLSGFLHIPETASEIILFAHGSGSSRLSPRNQLVARYLQDENFGTFLFDLLTPEEEARDDVTRELRFDIDLLAKRLMVATDFIQKNAETKHLTIGYFGASTGAAAALIAAAELGDVIRSVVSRGGRPDLAHAKLKQVRSPTLLIVGGNDKAVMELNKEALALISCEKKLEIVAGASHLFEERGTLEHAAHLASTWFRLHP